MYECKLELNKEYKYKDICNILGWRYSKANNSFKKRQIDSIESSYEFYHPLDSHKRVKKSYVFTRQIKEPKIDDNRTDISYDVFELLTFDMVKSGIYFNKANNIHGNCGNYIYINTINIYNSFGFNPYNTIYKLKDNKDLNKYRDELGVDNKAISIFYNTILGVCKNRIFKRLDNYVGEHITKSIIGNADKDSKNCDVFPDVFLDIWNDADFLCINGNDNDDDDSYYNVLKCYSNNEYKAIRNNIVTLFERDLNTYKVNKVNKIYIGDSKFNSIDDIDIDAADVFKAKKVVSDSIIKAVNENINNRIKNPDKYSVVLDDNQKNVLARYLECFNDLFDNGILISGNSSDLNYQKD